MITLEEYEKLNPRTELKHGDISVLYATPNTTTRWRVDSLFEKEPITIEWIAGFRPDDVLVDVGANVGMYTVWAAKTRGVRVFAFEPESQNFALLNRNIFLNGLGERVNAYCLAMSDTAGLSQLHLSNFTPGSSCHSFGEQVDYNHVPMQPAYSQGCVSARLDDLIASGAVAEPDHVKIDVDGFEPKVVAGMQRTIAGGKLRSLLIEINQNLADHRQLVADLQARGFSYDPAQVAAAERKSGPFQGCAEYVFKR
ncbi:MAG: FkbM family methyltransferase [Betaproteobacteria bacterium]|nr:FkbM family methyltransferase [Betaproteobacteria bacterium]